MTTLAPLLRHDGSRCHGHPRLPAREQCSSCGRGLCNVCAFDCHDGEQLCPRCLEAAEDVVVQSRQTVRTAYILAGVSALCLVSGQAHGSLGTEMVSFIFRYLAPLFALFGFSVARQGTRILDQAWEPLVLNSVLGVVALLLWMVPLIR